MVELEPAEPEYVIHKIEWEGWPDALEWLVKYDFGDEQLNQDIYDATQLYTQLEYLYRVITRRAEELVGSK